MLLRNLLTETAPSQHVKVENWLTEPFYFHLGSLNWEKAARPSLASLEHTGRKAHPKAKQVLPSKIHEGLDSNTLTVRHLCLANTVKMQTVSQPYAGQVTTSGSRLGRPSPYGR